jgi:NAD-dependent DNA ligase
MKGEVFLQLRGIGSAKAQRLIEAGFSSLMDIDLAPLEVLAQVPGIGTQGALDLKEQVHILRGQDIMLSPPQMTEKSVRQQPQQNATKPSDDPQDNTQVLNKIRDSEPSARPRFNKFLIFQVRFWSS